MIKYNDFSLRRFSVPLVIIAAIVAWLYLGMTTVIPCSSECNSSPREFIAFVWLVISAFGGFMVTVWSISYLFEKHDVHPIDGLVDFVSGKVCKQINYEEESSGQAD